MSVKFNKVSKDLLDTIKDSPKKGTTPYDSVAEVVRIDGNTAWVHIAGGVEETPVMKTIDCKEGDSVQIRVSGGTAWVTGNSSAPPTDDTRANVAYNFAEIAIEDALKARESAENAERDAGRAYVAANSAEEQAQRAQTSADNAQDSADEATRQAGIATTNANEAIRQAGVATTNANEAIRQAGIAKSSADDAMASAVSATNSANSALTQLSTVEEVVDVLNWITEHGTYKASTDTEVVAGKFYFTRTGSGTTADPYVYTVVTNPTGNPSTNHYYELDSVDEAISNYVSAHLALTSEGLYVLKDNSGWKVLITNNGAYIQNPSGATVAAYSAETTIGNALLKNVYIDSNGIYVRNGSSNLAEFTGSLAQIGQNNASHTVVDSSGMRVYASDGTTQIANLGYGEGNAESGTATAPYFTFGKRSGAVGNYSVAEGSSVIVGGQTIPLIASGIDSHAEGGGTKATEGFAHAEGNQTEASGIASHAEGAGTKASGNYAHSEGQATFSSSIASHAEGYSTVASGDYSHSEGFRTRATGTYSHAQNENTIAQGNSQTAIGKNNTPDTTSAFIIGNGVDDVNTSNALTVDWNGNVNIASGAKYKINGTNLSASDVGALPLSGGTMTGQILTSFKNSVATGSYGSAQNTIDGLVGEVRFSSGCMGSASIGTAYTKGSITIPTGWYNYIYSPHRSGGANGSASGDNCNYGNLLLMGMTVSGAYLIRVSSSSISEVKMLGSDYVRTTFTPTSGSSYSSYGGCYYEKYGRTVHVHVGVSGLTTGTATTIFTLPSGYRPSSMIFGHGTGGAWNNIGYLEVNTSGAVTVRSQGTYCGADVTFMV